MKLTAKVVERLKLDPAAGRQQEVKDEGARGLFLRLYSQRRVWIFRYKLRGDRRVIVLGEVAAPADDPDTRRARSLLTLAEARDQAAAHAASIRKGEDPAADLQKAKAERRRMPTVEEFAGEYIERWSKLHNVRWKENEGTLKNWVLPEIGRLKLEDVHRRDIAALLDKCRDAGRIRHPSKIKAVLSKMFRFAIERGVIDSSPVVAITERQPATTKTGMTADQIRRWWSIADDMPAVLPSIALALRLLLLTGQRPGEVAGLRVDELDLEALPENGGATWHIPAARRKWRKAHAVALGGMAVEVINAALPNARGGFLFPRLARTAEDEPLPIRVDSGLTPALIKAFGEVPGRPTPHSARHTVASELGALGYDELEAGLVLGHQATQVTGRVYMHKRSVAKQRLIIEAWERRIAQILDEDASDGKVVTIGRRGSGA
ncbi:MAG: tyrosine-type recombinase/integrase [Afipia sp.]